MSSPKARIANPSELALRALVSSAVSEQLAKSDPSPEEEKSITTAESLPPSSHNTPNWTRQRTKEGIVDGYRRNYYINSCVSLIMESTASVTWVGQELVNNRWRPNRDLPIHQLLNTPNPFITRRLLFERLAGNLLLGGNEIWTKIRARDDGLPLELWPLDPDKIKVKSHPQKYIDYYEYNRSGGNPTAIKIEPKDIVHFMRTNLESTYWGMGQFEAGRKLVQLDNSSLDWQKVTLDNRAIVPGILGIKNKISDNQYKKLREDLTQRKLGGVHAGEDLIIGSDLTYARVGANALEVDWANSKKLNRVDICILFRVPPPMIGIYDDATLANLETAREIFWLDRIIPLLRNLQDIINLTITPEFGDPLTQRVVPDLSTVEAIHKSYDARVDSARELVSMGFAPRAVNDQLGLGFQEEDIIEGWMVGNKTVGQLEVINAQGNPATISPETGELVETSEGQEAPPTQSSPQETSAGGSPGQRKLKKVAQERWSDEEKATFWKETNQVRAAWEERIGKEIRRLLRTEQQAVMDALNTGQDIEEAIQLNNANWKATFNIIYKVGTLFFAKRERSRLSKEERAYTRAEEDALAVFSAVKEIGIDDSFLTSTVDSRVDLILGSSGLKLSKLLEEDGDLESIVGISKLYNSWMETRLASISASEFATITNYGLFLGASQFADHFSTELISTWIASGSKSRHSDVDGETIPLGGIFSNGLKYPGDPSGSVEKIAGCRCLIANSII